MIWPIAVILVFTLCVLMTGVIIPEILMISFKRNLFDEPDPRKIHKSKIPRLGGIAFSPVIFITLSLLLGVSDLLGLNAMVYTMQISLTTLSFMTCAMVLIFLVGIADDLVGVPYRAKFVAQIMCCFLLIGAGICVNNFRGFLGIWQVPTAIAWITTIGLSLFIVNAINLIDGIDGLASGLSSVAFLSYGVVLFMVGEYWYALVAAAGLGVLVPFFCFNVFGNPEKHSKIFMGDTGSLTIGMMLCILAFKIMDTEMPPVYKDLDVLVVAISPLVIPCFDVVRVFLGRLENNKSPFLPDKTHLHHKLLSIGFNQRWAMITIVASSILFTLFNAVLSLYLDVNMIIVIDYFSFFIALRLAMRYARWRTFRKAHKG